MTDEIMSESFGRERTNERFKLRVKFHYELSVFTNNYLKSSLLEIN